MAGKPSLEQRNKTLSGLLGEQCAHVAELTTENAALRAQLKSPDAASEANQISPETEAKPHRKQYDELFRKYEELKKTDLLRQQWGNELKQNADLSYERYLVWKERCEKAMTWKAKYEDMQPKYEKLKEDQRRWKHYVEKCRRAGDVDSRHPPPTPREDDETTPRPSRASNPTVRGAEHVSAENGTELPQVSSDAIGLTCEDEEVQYEDKDEQSALAKTTVKDRMLSGPSYEASAYFPRVQATRAARPLPPISNNQPERTSSNTTTVTGSDSTECPSSPPDGRHGPSSDTELVVVSARPVNRKRSGPELVMPPPTRVKREPNSPTKPIDTPPEDPKSPILRMRGLPRHQTSDLDVPAEKIIIPRKVKRRQNASSQENQGSTIMVRAMSSLSDGDTPVAIKIETGTDEDQNIGPRSRQAHAVGPVGQTSDDLGKALRNLDVNALPRRPAGPSKAATPLDRSFEEAKAKTLLLSEDGEDDASEDRTPRVRLSQNRRLSAMLEEPFSHDQILVKLPTPDSAAHRLKRLPANHRVEGVLDKASPEVRRGRITHTPNAAPRQQPMTPKSHKLRVSPQKQRPLGQSAKPRFRKPLGIEDCPPTVEPEDEPLRLRPLASLRLEDFRTNPKYMGTNFAWADTVRGKDQRRCLPGCTRPECCGNTFMKVAAMGGMMDANKNSDNEVLEAYFGANWAEIMGANPPAKRRELLQQARAAALANQFGKHRQAFERHSTPPGFWRTDMPSTQEAAEDRAKAEEMERRKVEERYYEAMRESGRWIFRDE